jgi:pimeloyl-ACP methyl ester carboxylesterase
MAVEPLEAFPQRPDLSLVELIDPPEYDADLGYTLIPSTETSLFSPDNLVRIPVGYLRGVSRAASDLLRYHFGDTVEAEQSEPESSIVSVNGHDRPVLITEPDPAMGVKPGEAVNEVILLGLTEMKDIGSGRLFHQAMANRFPDRRIVTLSTPGLSMSDPTLPVRDGYNRLLEDTAIEDFDTIRRIVGDSPTHLVANSLSTKRALLVAALNLTADGELQIDTQRVKLMAPAVGARNVAEEERFSEADADDRDFIDGETNKFYLHVPGNILRMLLRHPEEVGECVGAIGAYALAPHKLVPRAAVLAGNVKSAKEGVEWEVMKAVARAHPLHVIGGADCPLMQAQMSQWLAVRKQAPKTQIRLLEGYGHAVTIDGSGTAEQLAQMELAEVA